MLAPHLALGEGPHTPAPPQALPKFEVRKVYLSSILAFLQWFLRRVFGKYLLNQYQNSPHDIHCLVGLYRVDLTGKIDNTPVGNPEDFYIIR